MNRTTLSRLAATALASALLLTACGGGDALGSGDSGAPTDNATISDPLPPADETAGEGDGAAGNPGYGPGVAEGEPNPNAPDDAEGDCSAAGMMVTAVQPEGVSDEAAATWNRMRSLAMSCDYAGLARLGNEGEPLGFTFGGETDAAAYWSEQEANGDDPMLKLVEVTGLPAAVGDGEGQDGWFIWPAVHADPSVDANWDEVTGIYPPDVIEEWRAAGAYYGYRVAITPEGDWVYFTAGD